MTKSNNRTLSVGFANRLDPSNNDLLTKTKFSEAGLPKQNDQSLKLPV